MDHNCRPLAPNCRPLAPRRQAAMPVVASPGLAPVAAPEVAATRAPRRRQTPPSAIFRLHVEPSASSNNAAAVSASAPGDAWKAFEEMFAPDEICYSSLISAFVRNDRFNEAAGWFRALVTTDGLLLDRCTLGSVMTALGNSKRARQGKEADAQVVTRGLCGNVVVESSTLDMYAKCGMLVDARKVFHRMKV